MKANKENLEFTVEDIERRISILSDAVDCILELWDYAKEEEADAESVLNTLYNLNAEKKRAEIDLEEARRALAALNE